VATTSPITASSATTASAASALKTTSQKSAAQALISKLGSGSGVDLNSLATNLVEAERAARTAPVNKNIAAGEARVSGYAALSMTVDTLRTAFEALQKPSGVNLVSANSSNTSAVSVTATTGAIPGTHEVSVTARAQGQRNLSTGFAATDTKVSNTDFFLRLAVGGKSKGIKISAANATPAGMVTAINNAKLGVTAQLINTGDGSASPYKIVLNGTSGSTNSFTFSTDDGTGNSERQNIVFSGASASGTIKVGGVSVTVAAGDNASAVSTKVKAALETDDSAKGVTGRTYTVGQDGSLTVEFSKADGDVDTLTVTDSLVTGATGQVSTTQTFTAGVALAGFNFTSVLQSASDASFSLNGVAMSRSSNSITDAIPGVTLNLLGTTTQNNPALLTVSRDTTAVRGKVKALVEAFNTTMSDLKILSGTKNKDDPTDIYSGALQNESSIQVIRTQLRRLVLDNSTSPSASIKALRDIGVSVDKSGVLTFNESGFDTAATNSFDEIVTMLTANKESKSQFTTLTQGLAGDAVKRLTDLTKATGYIQTQSSSAQKNVDRYKEQLEQIEARLKRLQEQYTKTFANLDSLVGSINSQRTSLKSTFDAMLNANNNN